MEAVVKIICLEMGFAKSRIIPTVTKMMKMIVLKLLAGRTMYMHEDRQGKTLLIMVHNFTLVIAQSYSTQCSTNDSKFQYKWGRFINGSDFRWQNVLIYHRGTSWTSISFRKTLCLAYCCHTSKQPNSENNRMKGSTNCNHAQYEMQSLCLFQIKAFVVDMYYGAFLLPMFFNILTQIWQPWSKN